MIKYIHDTLSRRWVIVSPSRSHRPDEFKKQTSEKKCVFCHGNESLSPDEVYRVGKGDVNKPGWDVRVVNNIFPITEHHEVVIHSPDHTSNLHTLPLSAVQKILLTYRERFTFHKKNGHVMIFCNHGAHAGASIEHSHSQLVVIPNYVNLDTLNCEPVEHKVIDSAFFQAYCPEFSQWPYEIWISPKEGGKFYSEITEQEAGELAQVLQTLLKRLLAIHSKSTFSQKPFSYNFYIHPKKDWFLRIIPRFITRAGFELGTGLSVNIVDPADAASQLQEGEPISHVMTRLEKWK